MFAQRKELERDRLHIYSAAKESGFRSSAPGPSGSRYFTASYFPVWIGSSRKHWTSRNSIIRFFSRSTMWVPSPNST